MTIFVDSLPGDTAGTRTLYEMQHLENRADSVLRLKLFSHEGLH